MKTCLFALLAITLNAGSPARAGLDFNLQHKALSADGLSLDKPFISDGPSKIFLTIPRNWGISDGGAGMDLTPEVANSSVRIGNYQGSKLLTIDQAGGQDLLGQINAQLPPDAKNAKVLTVNLNPLAIFGWQTMEVTLTYDYFGQAMRRSLMYLSMFPGRVVQFTVVAPDADFDKVHKAARQILSSWFEPSRDLPPDLQEKYEHAASPVGG
jgi:hypothetical protein